MPCARKPPNGPSKNLLGNQTGLLEARSGVCVFRVPKVALQEGVHLFLVSRCLFCGVEVA